MGCSEQISGAARRLRVSVSEAGGRLDRWLAEKTPGLSRAQAQRSIEAGLVRVNAKPATRRTILQAGDEVEVRAPEGRGEAPEPQARATAPGPEKISIETVYEDDHILVVNKPPLMVVHPVRRGDTGTLVHGLLAHTGRLSTLGGPDRPGIVHRLDRGTSGLLVVAKTDGAHVGLAHQFKARTVAKEYVAVVWGRMPCDSGTVSAPLGRHRWQRKKMAVRCDGGREADTAYGVDEILPFTSLVRLKPGSGRTHQLRVHLAYIGHPIFGDPTYGGRRIQGRVSMKARRRLAELLRKCPRQALHAEALSFEHPVTGRPCRFRAPPPEDMEAVLVGLRELRVNRSVEDRGGRP